MMQKNWLQGTIIFIFGLGIAAVAGPAGTVYAKEDGYSPISVDIEVDKPNITVGDIITLVVILRFDPAIQPASLDFSGYFKGFDLIDSGATGPDDAEGQVEFRYWYRLRADEVGDYTVPPVPITFIAPDPQNSAEMIEGQILSPETILEVKSILYLQGPPTDIRDIKSILEIGGWSGYYLFAFLVALAAGLGVLFRRLGKKKSPTAPTPSPVSLPPHERAMQELQVLRAKGLTGKGLFREHYFELSEIFRRYLEARYSFPALDWTTQEITQKLSQLPEPEDHLRKQAGVILEHTDKVKFAKTIPSDNISNNTMNSIMLFIQATQPPLTEGARPTSA